MKSIAQQHRSGELMPPHDIDAEQSVIGSILIDQDRLDDVLLALRAKDFYVEANRLIFETICAMADEGKRVDALLLHKRLEKLKVLGAVGGLSHVTHCAESVPTASNAKHYARIIHERALQRSLIGAADAILAMGYDLSADPHESLARAESEVFRILEDGVASELPKLDVCVSESARAILARMDAGGGLAGLTTGYPDLDAVTGGMRPGELVILAARPSMGKTALACNIAERLSMDAEHRVLFVSLEMPRLSLSERILCSHARVDSDRAARGTISQDERGRIMASAARLATCEFFIDDMPGRMASEVAAQARRLKRKPGLDLIVVDYLQRLRPANARDERERQVASMAQSLKNSALELGVPILCLAQLNRQVESAAEKRPSLGHLRECLVGDASLISADTGARIKLSELRSGMSVLAVNSDQQVVDAFVDDVWSTGRKPVFKVETRSGRSITGTENHPVMTARGWRKIGELCTTDKVAIAFNAALDRDVDDEMLNKCRLLGYLAGNGSVQRHRTIGLIVPDDDGFAEAVGIINTYWPEVRVNLRSNGYNDAWISRSDEDGHGSPGCNPLINWLKSIGFHGCRDENKTVPATVFASGTLGAAAFLAGYLATDGCVKFSAQGYPSIQFDTTSLGLAKDTMLLCSRIGVFATLSPPQFNSKSTKPIYRVSICKDAANVWRFATAVRLPGERGRKLEEAARVASSVKTGASAFALPDFVSLHAESVADWRHQGKRIGRRRCRELAESSGDSVLAVWSQSDLVWDSVASVARVGDAEVFDLRIPSTGCFLTDEGFVAHNSGAIEQEADQVWFVHRDDYFRPDNDRNNPRDGKAEVIVRKNRMGNTGTVNLLWFPERTRFESVAREQTVNRVQYDRRAASANGTQFDPDQYELTADGAYAAKDF